MVWCLVFGVWHLVFLLSKDEQAEVNVAATGGFGDDWSSDLQSIF